MCILASSSAGNCTYIGNESVSILIDAGLSGREIEKRLETVGASPADLQAICLSHEHTDHISGAYILSRKYGIPLYANSGTHEGTRLKLGEHPVPWKIFTNGQAFEIGALRITPFSVPHDAYDPVGFLVEYGNCRIGIATDIGLMTTLVKERLKGCHAVILESNHDELLLQESRRPWSLKQRINGRQGHLSNRHAAEALAEIMTSATTHIYLAHLSKDCNRCDLAHRTVQEALHKAGHGHPVIELTYPDKASSVWYWNQTHSG